jgi:hypothetical protein
MMMHVNCRGCNVLTLFWIQCQHEFPIRGKLIIIRKTGVVPKCGKLLEQRWKDSGGHSIVKLQDNC